jgi:NitT/TauT family transport system substrate-binding protein
MKLVILILIASLFLVGCSTTGEIVKEVNEEVSVRLPIPFNDGAFAPFYSAIDQGYFAEEGLDVTYHFGSAEANPVKMVITGQDDIGIIGGPDTLLVARSKGHPVKAFALYHRYSDFPVLITKKDSGITTVGQLDGKKVGFFYGHISTDVLRNLFRKQDVSVEEIDVGVSLNLLLTEKIDAQWWFRIPAEVVLPAKDIDVNIIHPKDYGIMTHGYTFFSTEETILDRPEVIEKFMRAIIKATKFSNEYPEEAILSVLARDETLKYEIELEKLKQYNKVTVGDLPIGYIDENILKGTYERLLEEDVLESPFNLRDAFTSEILKEAYT